MSDTTLGGQVAAAAEAAGLVVVASAVGKDFSGEATARFTLATAENSGRTQVLELSQGFDLGRAELAAEVAAYLAETAKRLKNPRPECYLTLHGLPLSFEKFEWPFHGSTSGADTFLVHGEVKLEDGESNVLHAKIAASMTVTFKEVVAAMEQPFAEGFIYNAVRKTMDQGQLELVKSGNRQPVPVTTRYYSAKQSKFVFNDTDETQRSEYLKAKVYWLSGVLGGDVPVWVVDPRDAQYLNTSVTELKKTAEALAIEGAIKLEGEFAKPTEALRSQGEHYRAVMAEALAFIKPTFNEDMRGGHTNM
jgi:hypothetical protein